MTQLSSSDLARVVGGDQYSITSSGMAWSRAYIKGVRDQGAIPLGENPGHPVPNAIDREAARRADCSAYGTNCNGVGEWLKGFPHY